MSNSKLITMGQLEEAIRAILTTTYLTAGSGAAYTVNVPWVNELIPGVSFLVVPHTNSTTKTPTLNVNGLGAKQLRIKLNADTAATTTGIADNWIVANKPVVVTYDGTYWETNVTYADPDTVLGLDDLLEEKQDMIVGSIGDFVIVGADGNVTTKTVAIAEEATY